jgi:phosphoribosylanthranilate isomerase
MTRVKICGITNLKDARAAIEAGADLLGFIFYEPSPRYISPETVRAIIQALDGSLPGLVGVFVNTPLQSVQQIMEFCRLDAAQLHGDESPEFVAHFQGCSYKALRPQTEADAEALLARYQPAPPPAHLPAFLIDAYHPNLYGGTGHVTDWTVAGGIARRYPILLAGSLTPANVGEAIRAVQPWGVDVSSGVEAEKGKKDHEKVRAFVREAKRNAFYVLSA